MKKTIKSLIIVTLISFTALGSYAQIIVKLRPNRPREVVVRRPPPPSAHHVWVQEEWRPEGGRYVWHGGYWAAPPHEGARFIPGHWRDTRRGSIWIPGRWV